MIVAVPLHNQYVHLEPLRLDHADDLYEAARIDADEVFEWTGIWQAPRCLDDTKATIAELLTGADHGTQATWAIRRHVDGRLVGSTSYLEIEPRHRRVEVGATWLGRQWWRTEVNTATKLLVLGHAFEDCGVERVTIKTDTRNERSARAIARLGAVQEGVLRHHMLRADGSWRDSVYFSIIASEWSHVRDRLADRLHRGAIEMLWGVGVA